MRRAVQFSLHVVLAVALAVTLFFLAMATAFGEFSTSSVPFVIFFGANLAALVLVSVGSVALLRDRMPAKYFLASGPVMAVIFLSALAISSLGRLILVLPCLALSVAALIVDWVVPEGGSRWPQ